MPKELPDIRRENLKTIIREAGGNAAFARRLKVTDSQVTQWANGSPDSKTGKRRGMSHDTCRRIEMVAPKPIGWMDIDHGDQPQAEVTLLQAVPIVLRALEEHPDRDQMRPLLQMILENKSSLVRQRMGETLLELLTKGAPAGPFVSGKPPLPLGQSAQATEAGPRPSEAGSGGSPTEGASTGLQP